MFKLPNFTLPKVFPKLNLDLQSKFTLGIITCVAFGIEIYLSLIDLAGNFGSIIGNFIRVSMGRGAVFVPLFFFAVAVFLVRIQRRKYLIEEINGRLIWGLVFMVWAICGYLNLFNYVEVNTPSLTYEGGGIFGYFMYPLVLGFFGSIGGFVMLFFVMLFGFFLFSQMTPYDFIAKIKRLPREPELFWDFVPDIFEFWRKQTNENLETKDAVKPFESVTIKTELKTPDVIMEKITKDRPSPQEKIDKFAMPA